MLRILTDKDVLSTVQKNDIQISSAFIPLSNDVWRKAVFAVEQQYKIHIEDNIHENEKTLNNLADLLNNARGFNKYTVRDLFDAICNTHTGENAIEFDSEVVTYSQLRNKVLTIAGNLTSYGVEKGMRVALIMDNCIEYIYMYFSLFYIGALPVPISNRWGKQELFNVLDDSDCRYVITKIKIGFHCYAEYVDEFIREKEHDIKVFYINSDRPELFERLYYRFEELLIEHNNEDICFPSIYPKDYGMISYTSGTTGVPKGVLICNNDIVKISCYAANLWKEHDGSDFPLSIAPLYSAQGFMSLFANFASEKCFKMLSTFNPNDILKEISTSRNTSLHTQPTMWSLLLNCKIIDFARFDGLKKVIVSGSVCSAELSKKIERKIRCKLLNCYGLIEGTSVATMTRVEDDEDIRFKTVGRPIPGVTMKIVDKYRNEVEKGEVGELAIKGYVMHGYYHNSQKTAEIVDKDGWLYTGDLARYFDDENISIVGRCKDMIIRGGFNVYPSDIEEYIMQLPKVQDVSVVGRPHDILGEEIVAFIIPVPGEEFTAASVKGALFRKLSNYKIPDKIFFVAELPIILAGKVDKEELKQWAVDGIPQDKQMFFTNRSEESGTKL